MAAFTHRITVLWHDVLSAVENKQQDPGRFDQFYIGRIDACANHAPVHSRKHFKRLAIAPRHDQFSLSEPLAGILLTCREMQVLYLICSGYTNRETADRMALSPRTVEYYIKNMRKKSYAMSKSHLIQLVIATDFFQRVDQSVLDEQ